MNPMDKAIGELSGIFLTFKKEIYNIKYDHNILKRSKKPLAIQIIILCYCITNLILIFHKKEENVDNQIYSCLMVGIGLVVLGVNIFLKNTPLTTYLSIYCMYIIFSLNNFQLKLRLTRYCYFGLEYCTENNLRNGKFIYFIDFFFLIFDVIIKIIWVLSYLNNFRLIFVGNLLTIPLISFLYVQENNSDYFHKISMIIYYIFFYLLIIVISRIMFKYDRILFLYEKFDSERERINKEKQYYFVDTFNNGYLKLKNFQIVERNNFFIKERKLLEYLIGDDDNNSSILQKILLLENNLTKEDSIEFVSLLLSNIVELNSNIKLSKQVNQKLTNSSEVKTMFNSPPNFNNKFETNECLLKCNNASQLSDSKLELEDNHKLKGNIICLLKENSELLKNFTYIGKKEMKRDNKLLTLENFVKIDKENEIIEFIFNDVTKQDLELGLKHLIVKSGQFLHDFKNPLICIHNEISELKENNDIIFKILSIILAESNNSLSLFYMEIYQIVSDKYEYIKNMSNYCQNMIASYEDLARNIFKQQEIKIKKEIFNLKEMLAFINTMMRYKFSNKSNLDFILKDESIDNDFKLTSDENKIKQVLINLLSNSEKFTPKGEISLTVKPEIIEGKRYVKFTVKDSGLGMSQESVNNLFTPFFSIKSNEINSNGVGLGLLIVRDITEKLGKKIELTSELGKGTSMWFYVEDNFNEIFHSPTDFIQQIGDREKNLSSLSSEEFSEFSEDSIEEMIDIKNNYLKSILRKSETNNLSVNHNSVFCRHSYTNTNTNGSLIEPIKNAVIIDHISSNKRKVSLPLTLKNRAMSATEVKTGLLQIFRSITNSSFPLEKSKPSKFESTLVTKQISFEIKCQKQKETETITSLSKIITMKKIDRLQLNFCEASRNSTALNSGDLKLKELRLMVEKRNSSIFNKNVKNSLKSKSPKTLKPKNSNNLTSFTDFFRANYNQDSINESDKESIDITKKNKKVSVLIVDDMPSIRRSCVNLFKRVKDGQKFEFEIDEADDGFSALVQIISKIVNDNQFYDIIVLDEELKFLNGSDLIKIIHFIIENNLGVKAGLNEDIFNNIFVCTSDSETVRKKLNMLREDHVMEKPFNAIFVKNLIKNL